MADLFSFSPNQGNLHPVFRIHLPRVKNILVHCTTFKPAHCDIVVSIKTANYKAGRFEKTYYVLFLEYQFFSLNDAQLIQEHAEIVVWNFHKPLIISYIVGISFFKIEKIVQHWHIPCNQHPIRQNPPKLFQL